MGRGQHFVEGLGGQVELLEEEKLESNCVVK